MASRASRRPALRGLFPLLLALVPSSVAVPVVLAAQSAPGPGGWNDPRVLEAVARARAVRQEVTVDSAFLSYRADARGYVYFYIDRPDSEERSLVKADQIAIEMSWRAPDQVNQRIVGLRDEKVLPTNVRYHLDHLTVVQDEFGDVMRIGDGDEVSAVVHPVAPGSGDLYDFRLADSLTISFPGAGTAPVRVYDVQVRPRDFGQPGFVGSIFLDRDTGAIVRMNFTFTPASYVDSSLDYIRISLDNSLWEGRYWLPYRQEAELRREIPQLDFVGSVIRGRFEIGGYEINADIPDMTFRSLRVTAVPVEEREAFPFERPLFDDLEREGLLPPPSLDEIRRQALEIAEGRYLSGLSRMRLRFPSVSDMVRYNRAEGVFTGAGAVLRPFTGWAVRLQGGYAFGAGHASASLRLSRDEPLATTELALFGHQLRDIGPFSGAPGLLNSLSAATGGPDYLDPYYASGARLGLPSWRGALTLTPALVAERHRSATLGVADDGDSLRPLLPIDAGDLLALDLRAALQPAGALWQVNLDSRAATFEGRRYATARASAALLRDDAWRELTLAVSLDVGAVTEEAPAQELFLLGGRETLLGHPYRDQVGERFWLARAHVTRSLVAPWITGRLFTAAGEARLSRELPAGWAPLDPSGGARVSAGVGLGLAWDIVQIDLGRGLGDGGRWELSVGASRRFRSWM